MTTEQKLRDLQKEAFETGDFQELEKFFKTPEYKELPYIVRNDGFVTSHKLKDFLRCGFCYKKRYIEKVKSPYDDLEDRDALIVGQAFDDLITEGQGRFDEIYEVVARRVAGGERRQLTKGMGETVTRMKSEFSENPLFDKAYDKKIMFAKFGTLILKIEMDGFDDQKREITDAKTCANIAKFNPGDYLFQAAFYHLVAEEVTLEKYDVVLDVVDKHEGVSRSAQFRYDRKTLEFERGRLLDALEKLQSATETDFFLPAKDQSVLWDCPYYGVQGHGRPTQPFTY